MKKLFIFSALLIACLFAVSGVAFGWGGQGGDGSDYRQLQETAVFYNNSSTTLYHGDVVILDSTGTADTTLGSYVTYSSAADSVLAVGVVIQKSLTKTPVVVCTKGPVVTRIDDSSDAVTTLTAVGTCTSSGATNHNAGGGTNLGIALEAGDGTNADEIIVWVDPAGSGD